jgi:hypothetical protein
VNVSLPGKKDFAYVIRLRTLRQSLLGYIGESNMITGLLVRGRKEVSIRFREGAINVTVPPDVVVVHICNPSTQDAMAGELQVGDQLGPHSQTRLSNPYSAFRSTVFYLPHMNKSM